MKNKIKGIIFDLDGVLVFTDRYHYEAWKQIADELGVTFDEQVNDRLRGVSRMDSLEIILETYDGVLTQHEKEQLAARKNDSYRALLAQMTPQDVSDEVRNTLEELRARGYRLAIGSSSKNARFILEQTQLFDAFDAISDGTNITRSKPDPEVFVKAAGFLSLDPAQCLVIEDADAGIMAAKAGGMYAAGIGGAAEHPAADVSLHTFSELLRVL